MPQTVKLLEIINEIDATLQSSFRGKTFWITSEINNVKKIEDKRWCYLEFCDKFENTDIKIKGVCWARNYKTIELFESITRSEFKGGMEITCKVSVSFYKGGSYAQLEILEIDYATAIGKLELEKQETFNRLEKEKIVKYDVVNGNYKTENNILVLPIVIQNIAFISPPNSDGQRDFRNKISENKYGYHFTVKDFATGVQGSRASKLIIEQLKIIEESKEQFDIVVIARGGGSDMDFNSFNNFDLAKCVATFPIPILTGIGHDRNTSIVDVMARQHKTPTEVANFIIEHNFSFDSQLQELKHIFFSTVNELIEMATKDLKENKRRVKNANPITILNKGFAIIKVNDKIVTDPSKVFTNCEMQTIMKNEIIFSTVINKRKNENKFDI
jgi:exodeoxyribonuclease VII large subunit